MLKIAASFLVLATSPALAQPSDGPLSAAQTAAGWSDLTGADAQSKWHLIGETTFPASTWSFRDGEITCTPDPKSGGRDLVTANEYGDFELVFEFRTEPGTNSGVKYRVESAPGATQAFGPEYQVLDDAGSGMKPDDEHSTGSLYDLAPPANGKSLRPPGEWNSARIRVRDGVTQHWLNGTKVVEVPLEGPSWDAIIADSKFKDSKTFARSPRGRIALQDHGGKVAYRNVRVRDLDAPLPGEVALFDGKSTEGWTPVLRDQGRGDEVWSVKDGVLVCTGKPVGYIRTKPDFTNYVLRVVWRFNPVTKQAGNSGVLLRVTGEDRVWPKSVEAQLQSGAAGDFWCNGDFPMTTDASRRDRRRTRATHTAERDVGRWNDYEIVVDHETITLFINGEQVNQATDVLETAGAVALQSEGAEIHFKSVRLAPIP
ncbi:MAG: 3-keto-disaccharide hydrolase [Phycisphaerales bacterium]